MRTVGREVDGLRPDSADESEDTLSSDPRLHSIPLNARVSDFAKALDDDQGLTKSSPSQRG